MTQITIDQAFQLAVQHHRAGRLPQAENLYRQILAQHPAHAGALHHLGVIAHQAGRSDIAVDLIRKSLAIQPDSADAYSNLGMALSSAGLLDQAIAAFRQAIALNPQFALACNNLGNALREKGQLDDAVAACRHALALKPDFPEAHSNLGNALKLMGQLDEAIAAYRQAIALNPGYSEAHSNLANALTEMGQFEHAIAACRQAITLKPDNAQAFMNLGNALRGKGDSDDAIAAYRQALVLRPDYAEAHSNLGNALADKGQLDEALAAHRQAVALQPHSAEANSNLGNALKDLGQPDDAIAAFGRALALRPNLTGAHSNLLFTLHLHPDYDAQAIAEEHRRWNHQHAEPLKNSIVPSVNDHDPDRRVRIGYLSPDFREHTVARLLLPLLAHHDKSRFEIYAYAQLAAPDAMTQRLGPHTDHWRSTVGLSDARAADLIRDDRIDILIDLAGHTNGHRLMVMGRKPAPIPVTFLGYPNTTGLTAIDYRITDALADPPGQTEQFHSEQLIRLPDGMWCYDPIQTEPPVNDLPAESAGRVTFGCLNNFCKLNEKMLGLWAAILRQTPQSRLMLLAPEGSARNSLLRVFQSHEIAPQRIDLRTPRPRPQYLRLYHELDIALDPFPYHGTATTCDALWMGLPVITLAGTAHVSRVGVSLLTRVGLPELVAHSPEQYVQIAADLAADLPRLRELRQGLRQRMLQSPLMDGALYARNVENAYRHMWQQWCATPA